MNKEVKELLNKCDTCKLKQCEGCEFTYTDIQKIKKYVEQKESILDKVTEFIKDDVTTEDIKFEGSKLFSTVYKSLISKTKEKIVEGINSYKNQIENIIKEEKEINLTVFNSTLQ